MIIHHDHSRTPRWPITRLVHGRTCLCFLDQTSGPDVTKEILNPVNGPSQELNLFLESVWSCGWFLAVMFVFLNMTVQLACSFLVMFRKNVKEACYALFFIIALQTVGYSILWDPKFLAR